MRTPLPLALRCSLVLSLSGGVAALSAQTAMIAENGGDDSWNDPTNWTAGVPAGPIDASVEAGIFAQATSASTPSYNGTLTLREGATLKLHCSGAGCGLGPKSPVESASAILMHAGADIQVNMNQDLNFPPITLLGDARLSSLFGASDWQVDQFGAITGAHTLTLDHFNGHEAHFNAANGFSELILDTTDRWHMHAKAAGSLGTGNVSVNPRADGRSASLHFDVDDAMADTASLFLNGSPGQGGFTGDGSDYVVMNADDTIAELWVWGVKQPLGTYDNSEPWLTGPGVLTVATPPTLVATPNSISVTSGGVQTLSLLAGAEHAQLPYLMLGSLSGDSPGFPLDGKLLPLNVDPYLTYTLTAPNTGPYAGAFGTLDAQGQATCTFTVPANAPPSLQGVSFWHAYVVIKLEPSLLSLPHISNAAVLHMAL